MIIPIIIPKNNPIIEVIIIPATNGKKLPTIIPIINPMILQIITLIQNTLSSIYNYL
jgi:hypothetical protein